MGVQYQIDGRILLLTSDEHFNTDDIIGAVGEAVTKPGWCAPMKLLLDLSRTREQASHDEVRRRAMMLGTRKDAFGKRCAVVVPNLLQFGLARQASAYAEFSGFAVHVFYKIDPARAWLEEPDLEEQE